MEWGLCHQRQSLCQLHRQFLKTNLLLLLYTGCSLCFPGQVRGNGTANIKIQTENTRWLHGFSKPGKRTGLVNEYVFGTFEDWQLWLWTFQGFSCDMSGVPAAAFHWHSPLSKESVKIAMVNFPALWLKAGALWGAGIQYPRLIIKDALR